MKIFIKKFIVFIIPVGLVFVFPIFIFILGREYYSASDAVTNQIANPQSIFGLAYTDENRSYKELLIKKLDPTILSLGTSRAGAFRKDFFSNQNLFANASNAVTSISEALLFIKALPKDSKTKIIMLGLDQTMFFKDIPKPDQNGVFDRFKNLLVASWQRPYSDYYYGRFKMQEVLEKRRSTEDIGLNAMINGRGFRSDGSFKDGKKLQEGPLETQLAIDIGNEIKQIKNDRSSYLYGQDIRQKDIDSLNALLQLCKDRGIYVIAFMPPYPSAFYNELMSVPDSYKKMVFDLPKKVGDVFSKYGFGFYDFSNIKIIGAPDTEFSDISHGTDKIYLRMTIYMAEGNREFGQYVNIPQLKLVLQNSHKDFLDVQ